MHDLSTAQLASLRERLLALKGELASMLVSTKDGAGPVDLDEPIGRLSRMEAIQQSKMTAANRSASERRLQLVGAALTRLAEDVESYGLCSVCDEPIGYARLAARPEALTCLPCQSSREHR